MIARIKTIFAFGVISACAFANAYSAAGAGGKICVPVYKADSAGEPETFRYTAQVMPIETVNITSRISADLVKVGFKDGEYVEKGRLLYTFDDTRYAAMYKSDKSKIEEYEAKLIYAKNDYERTNELFKKGVSTKDEMESSLSQYKSYQASLLGAEADLILSEDDLKHCKIYSPISGVIGLTNYTEGNYITPSSGILATIVQLDPIRVKFSMSSRDFLENFSDIETLRKTCVVRLKLADDTFYDEEGEIEFINNEAVKTTDTVPIFAKFKNSKSRLLPNNTVAVYLKRKDDKSKVRVPVSAILHDEESSYVYVVDENDIPRRRNVVLGRSSDGMQFLNSGLSEGERVVSDGPHKVVEGVKIEVAK